MPVFVIIFVAVVFLAMLRQVNQYERGIKFTMGRYTETVEPGWRLIIPVFQSMMKVDMRVKAVDVPDQEAITRDNVSTEINAVIYYRVSDAAKAIIEVENFRFAISQLAQTTMRNIVGEVTLDELLINRDDLSARIKKIVDAATDPWGIEVLSVDLKDIKLPEDMKRTLAKIAEAEREKQATITKSEGEAIAADNLAHAARVMGDTPGALHLRTLNSLNDISSDQSNTIVFAVPLEALRALEGVAQHFGGNNKK